MIEDIDAAWDALLDAVNDATGYVRETALDSDPGTKAEGYAFLQAILSNAWISIGYPDHDFPVMPEAYSLIHNVGSPSAEYFYQTLHIDPAGQYRLWGNRGTAAHIDLQQAANWFGDSGNGLLSETLSNVSFDDLGLTVGADGRFDADFTVQQGQRDWWPRHARCSTLFIKQVILDWGADQPGTFHVERLDARASSPSRRPNAVVAARLHQQAAYIRDFTRFHSQFYGGILEDVGTNAFREDRFDQSAGHLDQRYWHAAMDLGPDEALLIEWDVAQADSHLYWGAILNDARWSSLDFRCHQASLNNKQVELDRDGVFRAIASAKEPGIANWLDTIDGQAKILMMRAKACPGMPDPQITKMRLEQASGAQKERARFITPRERAHALRARRHAFDQRDKRHQVAL